MRVSLVLLQNKIPVHTDSIRSPYKHKQIIMYFVHTYENYQQHILFYRVDYITKLYSRIKGMDVIQYSYKI